MATSVDGEGFDAAAEEANFARALGAALAAHDIGAERQSSILRAAAAALDERGQAPMLAIVPFAPGRRPTDEIAHPGLGSSDCAALQVGGDPDKNQVTILFEVGQHHDLEVDATIRLLDAVGGSPGDPLIGWDRRPVDQTWDGRSLRHALHFHPERDIPRDACNFRSGFLRRAVVTLRVTRDGLPIAADQTSLDVCDISNLGSLYARVIDRIIAPDTARQAIAARHPDPGAAYHPWYPVLAIGSDKAALYTNALVSDIVFKERHLSDPAWLLRVGVYLELLTCLGIFEAVRGDIGDVLSPEERSAFEHDSTFREMRQRINVEGWRRTWELRKIAFPRIGVPRAGPVSALNLINKKRATLAFLHVHHEDLKHAIVLAGANHHNSQETWQRVFRDAERAVLRKTVDAFPELGFLPTAMRELVLWQQQGIAGQQGLYPVAVSQYRKSMNSVARWAKERGFMDHTGSECVPLRASVLHAHMNHPFRVADLQRGDGYAETSLVGSTDGVASVHEPEPSTAEFEALLSEVPILQMLSAEDLRALSLVARPLLAMPEERLVVQDTVGDSLFVIADGLVEVLIRRDGADTAVDTMGRGAVFGEMALLTGARRTATVRALETTLIFEIGKQQYEPLLRRHPEWLDELAEMMESRLHRRALRLAEGDRAEGSIRERIRQRFLPFHH
jgi:CRP-like cAMP-binding protein